MATAKASSSPSALSIARASDDSLRMWNKDNNVSWSFGMNWTNVGGQFETYINKYLFPKILSTDVINVSLGNRFEWLAQEVSLRGQLNEEYVILDTVPVALNLSKNAELVLQREYPKMATKLYNEGLVRKMKFTLNNNDVRLNFATLGDAVSYALAVYKKKISDINVFEESEIKGMVIDYMVNQANVQRTVTSEQELFTETFNAILNLQNNSSLYNEARTATGGTLGRYTTTTALKKIMIITTDRLKTYLLDTKLANTFQVAGLDLSKKIISFDSLGGTWKTTADVTYAETATINYLRSFGDYQSEIGDVIPSGSVFTFDVSALTEFTGKVEEIKPKSDLFAGILDVDAIRYKRDTKDMLKPPFQNSEFDEITYWIHYYSSKKMSPFYNKITITGA